MKGNREREIKLSAGPGFAVPDLTGVMDGYTVVARPTVELVATYYDTKDLRLTRAGLSLRHRSGGGESGWTVKLPDGSGGPALVRREVNFEGDPGPVPSGAAGLVRAYVRNSPLVPAGRLTTRRTKLELRDEGQRQVAEIDDDEVAVLQGRRVSARFREVEVELIGDAPDELFGVVVRRLRKAGAGRPDPMPKIVRALGQRAVADPDIVPAELGGDADVAQLVQATLATSVLRLVRHDPGVRVGDDPEDVHQARVATRRLRSDLRTFRRLLDEEWVAALRAELAWVAGELGAVRDADVLVDRLRQHAARLPTADTRAASALLRKLEAERAEARLRLLAALDSPRYVDLVDDLVQAAGAPRLADGVAERPAADEAPDLVGRPWQHLAAAVAGLGDEPDDDALHQVRIRAKRCRYAAEAVAPVVGKPARRLAAAVAGLQEVLGELHDGVVAEAWLRGAATAGGAMRVERALAAGQLVAAERQAVAACRDGWPAAWKAAAKKSLRTWL